MNQYPVPQFIEREKKLLGPLSVRQSVVLGIGATVVMVSYFLFPFFVFVVILIIVGGGSISLSFLKMNGRPLTDMAFAFVQYFLQPKMYLFKKEDQQTKKGAKNQATQYVQGRVAPQGGPQARQAPAPTTPPPGHAPSEKQLEDLADFLDR